MVCGLKINRFVVNCMHSQTSARFFRSCVGAHFGTDFLGGLPVLGYVVLVAVLMRFFAMGPSIYTRGGCGGDLILSLLQ